jgi:hypothetical protein
MRDASFVLAVVCWGLLPGFALARVLRVDWSGAERVAGAAGLSLAVVAAAAYATEIAGLPMAPALVAAVVVAGLGLVLAASRVLDRGRPSAGPPDPPDWCSPPSPRWLPWLVLLLPIVVFAQLEPMRVAGPMLPPTLYDGLDHANWFRLILETRSVNPAEVLAPPLNADGTPTYYPWGLHAWLALVAGTSSLDPVAVFNRGLVAVSAVLPLSVYVFAARFTGAGWPAMAAATLSLMFWWLPYQAWGWGGHALVAGAVAALPVCRLSLDAVRDRRLVAVLAAGVCGLGLLVLHPSQAFGALIICATVTLVLAAGRAARWRDAAPFALALAAASVAMALGDAAWEPVRAFMQKARDVAALMGPDPRFDWPVALYLRPDGPMPAAARVGLGVLYVLGGVFAIRRPALRPLVALHVVVSLMIPLAARHTWFTSLWYHAPERIWYLQYAALPVLGALGIAGLFELAGRLARSRLDLRRREAWLWPAAVIAFMAAFHQDYAAAGANFLWRYAHRSPPMTLTDRRALPDYAWIAEHVPRGEVLFNAAADWGISMPFTGHRTVFWSGGYALDPVTNWHLLQDLLDRGDSYTSQAAREIDALGLRYIYAARVDPRLETGGRKALRLEPLAASAALERVYASPTASVFRIRDDGSVRLGLADSDLIRFAGFYGREQHAGRSWRWTNGDARVRISPGDPAAAVCFVRLLGPDPDGYDIRLDGAPVAFTERGHRVPFAPGQPAFELEILSPVSVPADTGGSDERALGVQVYDVTLDCGGAG